MAKPNKTKPAAAAAAAAAAINFVHLKFVVDATASPTGYGYMPEDAAAALEAAGLAELDRSNRDASNSVATRATATAAGTLAAHLASAAAPAAGTPAAPAPAPAPAANPGGFVIATGVELPAAREFGPRGSKYPFEQLAVGQSFFVPDTTAAKMSSTVNSAGNRWPANATEGRKFITRNVPDGAPWGQPGKAGAAVQRVAWAPKRPHVRKAAAAAAPAPAAPQAPAFPG